VPTLLVGLLDTADSGVGTVMSANGMWTGAPMCRPGGKLSGNAAGLNDLQPGRRASRDADILPPPWLDCPQKPHGACPGEATCSVSMLLLLRAYTVF
jgi:hypothetical protein